MLETDSSPAPEGSEGLGGLAPDLSIDDLGLGELAVGERLRGALEEIGTSPEEKMTTLLEVLAVKRAESDPNSNASTQKELASPEGEKGPVVAASTFDE